MRWSRKSTTSPHFQMSSLIPHVVRQRTSPKSRRTARQAKPNAARRSPANGLHARNSRVSKYYPQVLARIAQGIMGNLEKILPFPKRCRKHAGGTAEKLRSADNSSHFYWLILPSRCG
jgi:hypothetical protein